MINILHSKAIVWFCLVVGLLAIATVVAIKQDAGPQTAQQQLEVSQQNVEVTALPEGFPNNLPLEAEAKVTQNYNATTNDGRVQATRVFETSKTLDENYKIYSDYAKNNGWSLNTGIDQKDLKVITATKDGQVLQVTINLNTATQIKTVNISLSQSTPR